MTAIPRPEHPDPRFERTHWQNLNGPWNFTFDPDLVGEHAGWYHPSLRVEGKSPKALTIIVPFPWESRASGVERIDYKGAAWYEREITIPADWDGLTPFLNFGAIDWHGRVWINGQFAAEHENGYLPFSVDLSPFVQPGQTATITVRAFDIADAATLVGKQVPHWYTCSSGIWQTVWLEGRAPSHITNARIEPDIDQESASVQLTLSLPAAGEHTVRIRSADGSFSTMEKKVELPAGNHQISLALSIPAPTLWSPESPHLYHVTLELESSGGGQSGTNQTDVVSSYFGMRKISRGPWNGNEFEYILLNDEPVYLRGALDQAFHPLGHHSYPTDEIIRGDIELAKEFGLNMLRCHIKINDPRYYYWADKLGMLIMYDLPSPSIDTPTIRRIVTETLDGVIARDYNSPSIFAWVLFNETWGLTNHHTAEARAWLAGFVDTARQLDPSRLIEDNSVCRYDHVETDINSWHYYINDYTKVRDHIQNVVDQTYPGSTFNYVGDGYAQKTAPLMNSEYGGISAPMGDMDIAWCFRYQTMELRRHAKICGYVYTELDDIEWEHNGFVNYDRSHKEYGYDFFVDGMSLADINSADVIGLDAPPCQTLAPDAEFSAPLFISHWGVPMQNARFRWQLEFINHLGERSTIDGETIEISPERFDVLTIPYLRMNMPNEAGLAIIALWLEDDVEGIRCRNYTTVEVRADGAAAQESQSIVRFEPGRQSATSWVWPPPFTTPDGSKFAGTGSGWVEYNVALPNNVDPAEIGTMRLIVEAGACAGRARYDWPNPWKGRDTPQTHADDKYPSDLVISINGTSVAEVTLPDDPADARGTLSHHREVQPGSYGYLYDLPIDGDTVATILNGADQLVIRFEVPADATNHGGLSLYGDTLGCYPLGPMIVFG